MTRSQVCKFCTRFLCTGHPH